MSAYKDSLTAAMDMLAGDPLVRFVGYGLLHGRAGGTLKNVPNSQIVETPTAENLMIGMGIGLSLRGYKPVVYFERADFLFNAMDAIVNHLAAMTKLSDDEFKPRCIIRVTIGNSEKPLFTGPVHTCNPVRALRLLVPDIPIDEIVPYSHSNPTVPHECEQVYRAALENITLYSSIIFERKDLW